MSITLTSAIMVSLYVLQGIPFGLLRSIELLVENGEIARNTRLVDERSVEREYRDEAVVEQCDSFREVTVVHGKADAVDAFARKQRAGDQ